MAFAHVMNSEPLTRPILSWMGEEINEYPELYEELLAVTFGNKEAFSFIVTVSFQCFGK